MEASVSVGPPPRERAAQIVCCASERTISSSPCSARATTKPSTRSTTGTARAVRLHAAMLGHSNADAEDALQEVFMRASHLAAQRRPADRPARLAVPHRAQLLRRPDPPAGAGSCATCMDVSASAAPRPGRRGRAATRDPASGDRHRAAPGRSSARRSLMRSSTGCGTPRSPTRSGSRAFAVKSGLNRARGSLKAANEARDAACADIQADLERAHGRKVRMSGRSTPAPARLRGVQRPTRTVPAPPRPHAERRSRARGLRRARRNRLGDRRGGVPRSAAASVAGTTISVGAGPIAAKIAALVCCAALVGGGADELRQDAAQPPRAPVHADKRSPPRRRAAHEQRGHRRRRPPWAPSQAGSVLRRGRTRCAGAEGRAVTAGARVAVRVLDDRAEARHDRRPHRCAAPGAHELHETPPTRPARPAARPRPTTRPATTPTRPPATRPRRRRAADADSAAAPASQSAPVAPATIPSPAARRRAPARASSPTPVAGHRRDRRRRPPRRRRRRPSPAAAPARAAAASAPAGALTSRARPGAIVAPRRGPPSGHPRARAAPRPPRPALGPLLRRRRPLDGPRPEPGRLSHVALRRQRLGRRRRAAPLAGDDVQGGLRRAPARRRQGRDHAQRRPAAGPRAP